MQTILLIDFHIKFFFHKIENETGDKKGVLKLLKITLGLDIHNKSLSLSPMKNSHDLDGLTEKEVENGELDE